MTVRTALVIRHRRVHLPAWIKPERLIRVNKVIMTAENAAAIVDLLSPAIMNRGTRRSNTFE